MFGLLGRLGCLVMLVVLAAVGWMTHDSWYPKVRARFGAAPARAAAEPKWEPLTAQGAQRGRAVLAQLQQKDGPVYVNVSPGDLAAFALDSVLHGIGVNTTGAEVQARGDRLLVRAQVDVAELAGPGREGVLGPMSGILKGKQQVTVGGRLEVLKPGRAQFRVSEISVGDFRLPSATIPSLMARVGAAGRDSTTARDAIPLRVPRELADVRVANGRVTLYKSVP